MQAPTGYAIENGIFIPTDWRAIIFSPVVWVRFPHMLVAAYLTGAFCVAATGAWYRLKGVYAVEGRLMLRMGLFLAALLVPIQLFFGHLNGDYVHDKQPVKFAAIEGRWQDEQPAGEVLIAIPDEGKEQNYLELKIPYLGSLIASMRFDSKEVGLTSFPKQDRPPVAIPFFAFRVMVGCGLLMMALAWLGSLHLVVDRRRGEQLLLWLIFLSFPLPFVATLTGWFTAEVGRQPWSVYGLLRTADAVTPTLDVQAVTISLAVFAVVYLIIFSFGTLYVYRLLRAGPTDSEKVPPFNPKRPLAITAGGPARETVHEGSRT
jgi:cytochrome bd ubiquinol oxidase subunit I